MILAPAFGLVLLSALAAGGRLSRLADLRLRWVPLLWVAMVVQVLLTTAAAGLLAAGPGEAVHLATYVAGGAVLLRNLRLPGMWLIGLGGGMNLAAIAVNGGVMPAAPRAVAAAGLEYGDEFVNSGLVADARLAVLGDVFAVPEALPLSNVFSVGDVLLVVGVGALLHAATDSRWWRWVREEPAPTDAGIDAPRMSGPRSERLTAAPPPRRTRRPRRARPPTPRAPRARRTRR